MRDASNILRPVGGRDRIVGFLREEGAQGLVEYALILGIIAVAVIISMVLMRDQLGNLFSTIGGNVRDACKGTNQTGACK
jgi:pilus assembly protein Flp/PilA